MEAKAGGVAGREVRGGPKEEAEATTVTTEEEVEEVDGGVTMETEVCVEEDCGQCD